MSNKTTNKTTDNIFIGVSPKQRSNFLVKCKNVVKVQQNTRNVGSF